MVDLLSEGGKKKQLIGQAEILPMLVARMLWSGRMKDRDVLHYVDNDAARFATIRGSSPSRGSAWMVHAFWETEITNQSFSWLSRVPTVCNLGDGPSRGDWVELAKIYPDYKRIEWSEAQEEALLRKWGRA